MITRWLDAAHDQEPTYGSNAKHSLNDNRSISTLLGHTPFGLAEIPANNAVNFGD
jgi:hypothetical protein